MPGHGAEEVVALERVELDIGLGPDRRGAGNIPQQRDLAEVVAGPCVACAFPSTLTSTSPEAIT